MAGTGPIWALPVCMNTEPNSIANSDGIVTDGEALALSVADPSKFSLVVARYQREFMRKVMRIVRDRDEAEDIVQDTFIKIYRNAASYETQQGATFKSWAYAILTNTCFTYLKRRKRRGDFMTRADDDMLDALADKADASERMLEWNQALSAIARIPAMLGRMLSLALSGKTMEEIARIEGVPVGTVRTRLSRARKEARKYIS